MRRAQFRSASAPAIVEAYVLALEHGDFSALDEVTVGALTESELMRREVFEKIRVVLEESVFDSRGNVISTRLRANPLMDHARSLAEQLGHTAADVLLTRKSQGHGAVMDAVMDRNLKRDELLRSLVRSGEARLPPPASKAPKP